jgi:hypothetical protein
MKNSRFFQSLTISICFILTFCGSSLLHNDNLLAKTPKDTITYHIFIRLSPTTGSSGYIEDFWPNINLPAYAFEGVAWTSGGFFYIGRSLLKYDFSFIPNNAIVLNAKLSLYHNPTPDPPGGHAGADSCYLRKVTSNWDEYSVTWNNQPTTTALNQLILPKSISSTQDYLDLDVTTLVSQMINSPSTNFGLMINLMIEQTYRNLDFASGLCTDSTMRPRLELIYSIFTGIKPISGFVPAEYNLYQNYPNPFNPVTQIKFDIPKNSNVVLKVYDLMGREVKAIIDNEYLNAGSYEVNYDGTNISSGIYFYKLIAGDYSAAKRMSMIK